MSLFSFSVPLFPFVRFTACLAVGLTAVSAVVAESAGAGTVAPVVVHRVAPVFPPELKKELLKGSAVLECLVGPEGKAGQIHLIEATHPAFGQAAMDALARWEFTPGTVNGQPAPVRIRVPFEFHLSLEQILEEVAGHPVFMEVRETMIPAMQLPTWPRPKNFYVPRYPPELEGSGKYGKAVVNITIDKQGRVINPRIVKVTYPEFVMPALITALKLEFPPQVMANREVIYVNMDIQFDFKVPDSAPRSADKAKARTEKTEQTDKAKKP